MDPNLLVAIASLVVSVGSLLVGVLALPAQARTARGGAVAVAVFCLVVAGYFAGGIRTGPPAAVTPDPTPPGSTPLAVPTTPPATPGSGSAATPVIEPDADPGPARSRGGPSGGGSSGGSSSGGGSSGGGSSGGGSSGGGSSGGSTGSTGDSGDRSVGPTVVVNPRTAIVGHTVTLTGSGFDPDAPVTFRFEASGISWSVDGFASPDADGAFTENVTLSPPSCDVGGHVLAYYGDSDLLVRDASGQINEPVAAGAVTVRCG